MSYGNIPVCFEPFAPVLGATKLSKALCAYEPEGWPAAGHAARAYVIAWFHMY